MASPFPYTIERLIDLDGEFLRNAKVLCFKLKESDFSVSQIKVALSAAFREDQFTSVITDGDKEFYGDFWYSTVLAAFLGGEVYVAKATEEQNSIVGVAAWFPPNREMYDSEDQREQALSILWARFSDDLKSWWGETFLPRYTAFGARAFGEDVKLKSWHLAAFGVHPDQQRRGIARALIDQIKPKAKETNTPLCLETETETNVTIYQKLGFKAKGKEDFVRGTEGFPMWGLQQDPSEF